jgi:hypothetical protein
MPFVQRVRTPIGLSSPESPHRQFRTCRSDEAVRVAFLLAVLGCLASRPIQAQEPVVGDTTAPEAPDSRKTVVGAADSTVAGEEPAADSTIAPGVPPADSIRAPGPETTPAEAAEIDTLPGDSARARAASDTMNALPDSAAGVASDTTRAAADSAEAAAADTLEHVRSEVARTRERLDEVKQTLETIPEEDRLRYSPRGAVLRAFALPGWGQFYTGHTVRGFLYGSAEVAFATAGFLRQSQVLDQRDEIFQAKLDFVAADQALHPDSAYSKEDTLALYDRFEGTAEGLTLESELHDKQKSREDFFTYAIFTVLFSAIDAFVSAHLEPFDTAKLDVRPAEGGWRLDVRLPLGRGSATRGSAPDAVRSELAEDP